MRSESDGFVEGAAIDIPFDGPPLSYVLMVTAVTPNEVDDADERSRFTNTLMHPMGCFRCHDKDVPMHSTRWKDGHGCFPLCESCWMLSAAFDVEVDGVDVAELTRGERAFVLAAVSALMRDGGDLESAKLAIVADDVEMESHGAEETERSVAVALLADRFYRNMETRNLRRLLAALGIGPWRPRNKAKAAEAASNRDDMPIFKRDTKRDA